MTWLVWRLHRTQLYVGAALLAALTVLLLVTGLQMASQYHSALAACAASHSCANLASTLFLGSHAVGFLVIMTLGVPALFGLFWGAPLVAVRVRDRHRPVRLDAERHPQALARGHGRWMLLAAAAWGGAVSALVTWWSGPDNALQLDQFKPGRFDIMGIVPVGYALFAMALGLCAGALMRRTLPAMAVTLAGFIVVRAVVTLWLRPHYLSAVTVTYKLFSPYTPDRVVLAARAGHPQPGGRLVPAPERGRRRRCSRRLPPGCLRGGGQRRPPEGRPAGRPWPPFTGSSPTSPPAATGRSRASSSASSSPWRPFLIAVTAVVLLRRDV